jgi:hypothetical protein
MFIVRVCTDSSEFLLEPDGTVDDATKEHLQGALTVATLASRVHAEGGDGGPVEDPV